jgi:hypothetical protein
MRKVLDLVQAVYMRTSRSWRVGQVADEYILARVIHSCSRRVKSIATGRA